VKHSLEQLHWLLGMISEASEQDLYHLTLVAVLGGHLTRFNLQEDRPCISDQNDRSLDRSMALLSKERGARYHCNRLQLQSVRLRNDNSRWLRPVVVPHTSRSTTLRTLQDG
jgi:hypothetical protein